MSEYKYFDDNPCQTACGIFMKAIQESIALIDEGKPRRAQLVLHCALEDTHGLLFGRGMKKGG